MLLIPKIYFNPQAGKTMSTPFPPPPPSRDKTADRAKPNPRPASTPPEPGGGSLSFVQSQREAAGGGELREEAGVGGRRSKRKAPRRAASARPINRPRGHATNLCGIPRSKPTNLGVI